MFQRNVVAIVPRNANPERFSAVLDSVSRGMVCFPGEWLKQHSSQDELAVLSERQREVLKLLAAGESNKEIGRNLNISAATVKPILRRFSGVLMSKPDAGRDVLHPGDGLKDLLRQRDSSPKLKRVNIRASCCCWVNGRLFISRSSASHN